MFLFNKFAQLLAQWILLHNSDWYIDSTGNVQ